MPCLPTALPHIVKNAVLHRPVVVSLHRLEDCVVGPRSARVIIELRESVGAGQYVRRAN